MDPIQHKKTMINSSSRESSTTNSRNIPQLLVKQEDHHPPLLLFFYGDHHGILSHKEPCNHCPCRCYGRDHHGILLVVGDAQLVEASLHHPHQMLTEGNIIEQDNSGDFTHHQMVLALLLDYLDQEEAAVDGDVEDHVDYHVGNEDGGQLWGDRSSDFLATSN